jgi:DNA-binding CsgD family transcriptional regulator/PAS domain-containing protein
VVGCKAVRVISRSMIDSLEKQMLRLHAATDVDSFWNAVQHVIAATVPNRLIGLTLQHNPIRPRIVRWTRRIPDGAFALQPFNAYFAAHPRSKLVHISDVFPDARKLIRTRFYRNYLAPHECRHGVGLFFWRRQRLICIIAIMRTTNQGNLSRSETKMLRRLYSQFQIALRRLVAEEREHMVRVAFQEFLRRAPLPIILLRWNLKAVYANRAARELCGLWKIGPEQMRLLKADASLPGEILNQCRTLKKQWEQSQRLNVPQRALKDELVHHPKLPYLRATLSVKQLGSTGLARPHFLIEIEAMRESMHLHHVPPETQVTHLIRLTPREQQLARLVCDGRSNQEIGDETGMSWQTVKNQLHAVFRKQEVPSRIRLMALMS